MTDKIIVSLTSDSPELADSIARLAVEKRLAACVQIIPSVRSIYRWKGAVEDSSEWLLLLKTRRDLFAPLRSEIRRVHPYQTPEILATAVVDGDQSYLDWMDAQLLPPPGLQHGPSL